MVGSIFGAGSAMTQEFEQVTWDELILSNQSPHSIYIGKMLSGVVISYIAPPIILGLGLLMFGVWPNGDILTFIVLTLPLAIFCSGIGLILGALFRNSVYIVPLAALSGIFYWIVGGGIAPLELVGVTFGAFNEYLPISNVYRSLIRMFVEGSYGTIVVDLSVIGAFALAFMVLSPIMADKVTRVDFARRLEEIKHRRKQ